MTHVEIRTLAKDCESCAKHLDADAAIAKKEGDTFHLDYFTTSAKVERQKAEALTAYAGILERCARLRSIFNDTRSLGREGRIVLRGEIIALDYIEKGVAK